VHREDDWGSGIRVISGKLSQEEAGGGIGVGSAKTGCGTGIFGGAAIIVVPSLMKIFSTLYEIPSTF
jgi:hypothetical protein